MRVETVYILKKAEHFNLLLCDSLSRELFIYLFLLLSRIFYDFNLQQMKLKSVPVMLSYSFLYKALYLVRLLVNKVLLIVNLRFFPFDLVLHLFVSMEFAKFLVSYRNSSYLDSYLDPAFMSLIKDPDQRRKEQWEKTAQAQSGWNCARLLGLGDLGGPPLSVAEEYSLHSRYLSKANSINLSEIAEMKIVYASIPTPFVYARFSFP